MKIGKKIVLVVATFILIIIVVFCYSDRVVICILENKYNLDITYKKCSKDLSGKLVFEELSIASKSTGLCFTSKSALVKPTFIGNKIVLDFNLHDLCFTKRMVDGSEKYDTLDALVSSPFNSKWKYREMRGQLELGNKNVRIKNLDAISDQIKLSVNGYLFYSGRLDLNIVIYFAVQLTEKIPPELADVILADEKDGWKSLSVQLTGDSRKPSIQVSSKLFRLNIKSVSGS